MRNITDTLEVFSSWSGLTMNRHKTELFISGLNQVEAADISSLGFSLGSLHVWYLGLSLMHRNLRICDYQPLMDQLARRFSSWTLRALSYAGRTVLISSVIYSTMNFWFSSFILPKGCLKMIESLCSRFLLNGNISTRAKAKVSWSQISLPRDEGGLGFRNLCIWKKTLCLKFIWLLFSDSESIWAIWVKANLIQEYSFWCLDKNMTASWTWKALLKLRTLAKNFIRCALGNGTKASFWFDQWSPLGPLIDHFGPSGPAQTGIILTSSFADACSERGWTIRPSRSPAAEEFQIMLCSIPLPSLAASHDSYSWLANDMDLSDFSAKHTWESVRPRGQKQEWADKVWFKGYVPSHAFMMWVAQLDRLPTRSRLASWGLQIDTC